MKSVAEIAQVEGTLKTAMSDLVKVSASIGFFGIPALLTQQRHKEWPGQSTWPFT